MEFKTQKNIFCTSEASLCFTQKNNFCILFFIHYTEIIFLSKNVIFLYILKIFFYHITLKNIFRILNNSVYFQNIVVCNELLKNIITEKICWKCGPETSSWLLFNFNK